VMSVRFWWGRLATGLYVSLQPKPPSAVELVVPSRCRSGSNESPHDKTAGRKRPHLSPLHIRVLLWINPVGKDERRPEHDRDAERPTRLAVLLLPVPTRRIPSTSILTRPLTASWSNIGIEIRPRLPYCLLSRFKSRPSLCSVTRLRSGSKKKTKEQMSSLPWRSPWTPFFFVPSVREWFRDSGMAPPRFQ
jgi:hypothetical protein